VAALQGVSLSIAPSERVLLGGASGSGKSTLGLCLAGLIPHSVDADLGGAVWVDGQHTTAYPPGALAEQVGTVFQDPSSQFTMLTVEDEVAFGLENLGVASDEMPTRVAAALQAVGLDDRAEWRIDRLSGGQQQRVALAAALAMRPGALVLDEPTAHLDPRSATDFFRTLQEITDATVIVVEHDVDRLVPDGVERCVLLDRSGSLVLDAPLRESFGPEWLRCGVRLPTAAAVAMALGAADGLPLTLEQGADWLVSNPAAQRRLRLATGNASPRAVGEEVLSARGIWQRYRTPRGSFVALKDVDLSVAEGEMVAVVGANGSGKSSLLRALTGLLPLERGEITIGGVSLSRATPRQIAGLVAHVFQNPEAGFVADTVEDEVAYGPTALGWSPADVEEHSRGLLERFGLLSLARANPYTLSEGQKRRLSVATSLVLGPRVLLLDEPTFGQDRVSAEALMAELAGLREQGLAILIATHDLGLVTELADRVVALHEGEVVFDGPPAALAADQDLLCRIGQEPPMLDRLVRLARRRGAQLPSWMRWADVRAAGLVEALAG
jgi:energy-coupling factor transport system ATP-binding protein